MLDREKIEAILPHRQPFLFVDRVTLLEPGKCAQGEYYVDPQGFWFDGHFPQNPIFPGVLQIEALAQLGAVAILSQPGMAGKLALFAGLEGVKFRRLVRPGETLEMEVEIIRARGSYGVGHGAIVVGARTAMEARLKFALMGGRT